MGTKPEKKPASALLPHLEEQRVAWLESRRKVDRAGGKLVWDKTQGEMVLRGHDAAANEAHHKNDIRMNFLLDVFRNRLLSEHLTTVVEPCELSEPSQELTKVEDAGA